MHIESDRRLAPVGMLLLTLLAVAVPAAAAPVTSADDPTTTTTTTITTAGATTDQQLLDSLPGEERVAVMAYQLAAALQRLAEQVAKGSDGDVTEEARIVTRGDSEQAAAAALHLQPHGDGAAKIISLSEKFHSILNRWVHTTSTTDYKVMKVRARITICFPFNVCFQIQDPWSLCCPF